MIKPLMTLDRLLEVANRNLDDRAGIGFHEVMIMRLNWIVNDLKSNPMRKPIVVDQDWRTIVGDTRLMALDVLSGHVYVPVLIKTQQSQGILINNIAQLQQILGFDEHSTVSWQPGESDLFCDPISWFDIGDESTARHWLDEGAAAVVMDRYLNAQEGDFRFTRAWCSEPVDWYSLLD